MAPTRHSAVRTRQAPDLFPITPHQRAFLCTPPALETFLCADRLVRSTEWFSEDKKHRPADVSVALRVDPGGMLSQSGFKVRSDANIIAAVPTQENIDRILLHTGLLLYKCVFARGYSL